ncbi:hypothetical protein [Acidiphilium iwatense]|nr:hypothetical protein [Acidiphilium iwatense]
MAGVVAALLLASCSVRVAPAPADSISVQACRQAEAHSMIQAGMRHADNCQPGNPQSVHLVGAQNQSIHPAGAQMKSAGIMGVQIRVLHHLSPAEKQACETAKLHSVPQLGLRHPGGC